MTSYEIRPSTDDELDDHGRLREQGYGFPPPHGARAVDSIRAAGLVNRVLGAYDRGQLIARLQVNPYGQFFGGRPVPMGGIGGVVVLPEHRGRGIASALLHEALTVMRSRGEVVSALGPATIGVYRRAGWELAGDRCWRSISTAALAALERGDATERRAVGADHDAMKRVYLRYASSRPGMLARPAWLWDDHLELGHGSYAYVAQRNGTVVGYVIYSQRRAAAGYSIMVDDFAATDWDAQRCLWRHFAAHRAQATNVVVAGIQLDALALHLDDGAITNLHDHQWMLRLVDAPGAIAARGFNAGVTASVPLAVTDPLVATNGGAWVLDIADGRAQLVSGGPGTVELTVNAFAALYSGLYSATTLQSAGLVHGASVEHLGALDAAFSGPRPTMSDDF